MKKVMTTMFVVFFCGLLVQAAPNLRGKEPGFRLCKGGWSSGSVITGVFWGNTTRISLYNAWRDYVRAKLGKDADGFCFINASKEDLERDRTAEIGKHPGTVQVDWKFESEPSTSQAPAPQSKDSWLAPAPEPTAGTKIFGPATFYYCTANFVQNRGPLGADDGITYYITGVFSAEYDGRPVNSAWSKHAYETFIDKDHVFGGGQCEASPDRAGAEKKRSIYQGQHPSNTKEVDWVYSSSSAGTTKPADESTPSDSQAPAQSTSQLNQAKETLNKEKEALKKLWKH